MGTTSVPKPNITLIYTPVLLLVAKNFTALIPVCDFRNPFAICLIMEVDRAAKQTTSFLLLTVLKQSCSHPSVCVSLGMRLLSTSHFPGTVILPESRAPRWGPIPACRASKRLWVPELTPFPRDGGTADGAHCICPQREVVATGKPVSEVLLCAKHGYRLHIRSTAFSGGTFLSAAPSPRPGPAPAFPPLRSEQVPVEVRAGYGTAFAA